MGSIQTFDDQSNAFDEHRLLDINIAQLLDERSVSDSEKLALKSRWQGSSLTYRSLRDSTRQTAQRLLASGVRPKDRVVVLAGSTAEYTELFYAVGAIGAIFAIINPTFAPHEVLPAVEFLEPRAIFVADRIGYRKYNSLISDLAERAEHVPLIVQLGSPKKIPAGVTSWDSFCQRATSQDAVDLLEQYWGKSDPNSPMCIQFTSGTTGPRKAAMVSHSNLLNNALLVGKRLNVTADDVVCCNAPTNHCFGLVCGLLLALVYGCTAIIPSDVFVADATLEALSGDKCTIMLGVSSMFQALLDHPDAASHAPRMSLRTGIIAGSSFSKNLTARLASEFRFTGLAYGYGMTEASCIVFLTSPDKESLLDDNVSVGTAMPQIQVKVVDSSLNKLPLGSTGELLVSGYTVFKGYYKNSEKTAETIVKDAEGREWLRTGDLVNLDITGRATIVGRVKDMIKKGGENIFPSDIENLLETHPDIAAVAVVGVPDPYWGETVGAFVQHRTSSSEAAATDLEARNKKLKSWLRTRLDPQKVPDRWFWLGETAGVPDRLPVNATGKVEKVKLRAVAAGLVQGS